MIKEKLVVELVLEIILISGKKFQNFLIKKINKNSPGINLLKILNDHRRESENNILKEKIIIVLSPGREQLETIEKIENRLKEQRKLKIESENNKKVGFLNIN